MKLCMVMIAIIVLSGCSNNTEEFQPQAAVEIPVIASESLESQLAPSENSPVLSTSTPDAQSSQTRYLLIIPEIKHALSNKMLAIVTEFGDEYLFPEFADVQSMDFADGSVSTNLFWLVYNQNDYLLSKGSGVSSDEREAAKKLGLGNIIRYDDMNSIGRLYFGVNFSFPRLLDCYEIAPVHYSSPFYTWTVGRGGMSTFEYLLTGISENEDTVTATFLPYNPLLSWDDGTIVSVAFIDATSEYYNLSYDMGALEYPDDEARENADAFSCLGYYYLNTPQEELGTITITFQIQDDGNLIAISSMYSR